MTTMNEKEEKQEKSYDEKWRRDPIEAISWAILLIWAGAVLLLYNLDQIKILTNIARNLNIPFWDLPFDLPFVDEQAWQIFFLGAGVIVVIEILFRLFMPVYRQPIAGDIIWAGILFGLAIGRWEVVGPLIVIAIGLAILLGRLIRRR